MIHAEETILGVAASIWSRFETIEMLGTDESSPLHTRSREADEEVEERLWSFCVEKSESTRHKFGSHG